MEELRLLVTDNRNRKSDLKQSITTVLFNPQVAQT